MKNYNLKFGLQYKNNTWHVVKKNISVFVSACSKDIWMGNLLYGTDTSHYIYPIKNIIETSFNIDLQLSLSNLCPKCKKKFNLSEKDINHYIVLAKFKVKI